MEGSATQAAFWYQNHVAALKIIECLFFDSDIQGIRLENYDKGEHIDDIIVYRKNKIDYYQVKWAKDESSTYSLYNLIKPEINGDGKVLKKSLIGQLATGFLKARAQSEEYSIILFSTKKESKQKRPKEGIDFSLPEIRKDIFEPLKKSSARYDKLPAFPKYSHIIEKILRESELDEKSFDKFIRCLDFRLNQNSIEEIEGSLKQKLNSLGMEEGMFDKLLVAVVKWSISGESISKDTVLNMLGIADRFEDKLSQHFKTVSSDIYVTNQRFADSLKTALDELSGGYIFIEGLPGIGKSTALTKFREKNPYVTLAYYCFIPDVNYDFGQLRHQAYYFLKSLCISIEKQFSHIELPQRYSDRYEEKLVLYLEELGKQEKKIVFVIDGLDHVHRDTNLGENSLLNSIKGNLPKNIFFVLSSQYQAVLSPSVRLQINADQRRHIELSPFTKSEITRYLENKGITSYDLLDNVERISGGIPIYLHYISELLLTRDVKSYPSILNDLPRLVAGEINSYHEYLFQKIENDTFSVWILAVLAYRKENTPVDTISKILRLVGEDRSEMEVEAAVRNFAHLLRRIDGRSYSIFHNSFREFILVKTFSLKDRFNQALVRFYEESPFTDEAYRNYFSHLFELGYYNKILSITSVEWMKTAWSNFRSLDETSANIEIAFQAAIRKCSLSEFVRLAFLKSQFDRAKWNLENSRIDFPSLLLNAQQIGNSLRCIWDGDFVLTSREYFCYYLGEYYRVTGNLLPLAIVNAGFSKELKDANQQALSGVAKANALVLDDVSGIITNLKQIKWHATNRHSRSYRTRGYSDKRNQQINQEIIQDVIDFLTRHKKFQQLNELLTAFMDDPTLKRSIQIGLAKIFLQIPAEKQFAIRILQDIDFGTIDKIQYSRMVGFCCDFLSEEEIKSLFKNTDISKPKIFEDVLEESIEKGIRPEVLQFYEDLKPVWLYKSKTFSALSSQISYLPSPAREIYSSILDLSRLWNKTRKGCLPENEIVYNLKTCIQHLYPKSYSGFQTRSHGLFDMDTKSIFIANSIEFLFREIFNMGVRKLSIGGLETLVNYWIKLDTEGGKYRYYKVGLEIAKQLHGCVNSRKTEIIRSVIQHAETIARLEEDTHSLTCYLGNVAETFGACGFAEDFHRIYSQLIEISFGVAYRKDYQAAGIIDPLKMMHEKEPAGTLGRLAEVLVIQERLGGAGNARMQHICLSTIISFTAMYYPGLAFKLMELEESKLGRDEALDIILSPLIENCKPDEIILYLSIVKTIPRWKKRSEDEGYFVSLLKQLLEKSIEFGNEQMIKEIVSLAEFNLLIELDDSQSFRSFTKMIQVDEDDPGADALNIGESVPGADVSSNITKTNKNSNTRFSKTFEKLPVNNIVELLDDSYQKFEAYLNSCYAAMSQNRLSQNIRSEYNVVKKAIDAYYAETSAENRSIIDRKYRILIREYIILKNEIINSNSEKHSVSKIAEAYCKKFLNAIEDAMPSLSLRRYLEEQKVARDWIKNIQRGRSMSRMDVLSSVLGESDILNLGERFSIVNMDNLIHFIEGWTKDRIKSLMLIGAAERLMPVDLTRAKEILIRVATTYDFDNVLFTSKNSTDKSGSDILARILNTDENFGKEFLLKSYYSQKGRYSGEITDHIDRLFDYRNYFEEDVLPIYYSANLLYNLELAKGLPEKENRYQFITEFEEQGSLSEIIIEHLLWLLNYPVIKVRELAMGSILDLALHEKIYLQKIIQLTFESGSENQVEYLLIILQAIALQDPSALASFKLQLMSLLKSEHFNIIESAKGLLLIIQRSNNNFLTIAEIEGLKVLNTASTLILPGYKTGQGRKAKMKLYSAHQVSLLKELDRGAKKGAASEAVIWDLFQNGWEEYNRESEEAVHKKYNINTNFDAIEIESPYYLEVRKSMNRVFYSGIRAGLFEGTFIASMKFQFRVCDPYRLLYRVKTRPLYINWIPADATSQDFLNFTDIKDLAEAFVDRETEYLTLFECGSQRTQRYNELHGTCYFRVEAFLTHSDFQRPSLSGRSESHFQNFYAHELPVQENSLHDQSDLIWKPLVQTSENLFRGEEGLEIANLCPQFFEKFGILPKTLAQIFAAEEEYPLRAFNWINAYDQGVSRRRFKPSSEGFTLKIKKQHLRSYLQDNNMKLAFNITIKRSADEYMPEDNMYFKTYRYDWTANV